MDGQVTQEELYRAWLEAVVATGADEDDPHALTSREICQHILGWPVTEHYIRRTRARLKEWMAAGLVVATKKREPSIAKGGMLVPAYRLVEQDVDDVC